MNAKEEIKRIKDFRKIHKKKSVSTSHQYKFNDFLLLAKELKKTFSKFEAEFSEDMVWVTIQTNIR